MALTSRAESISGADLGGVDGATGRTYTLANSQAVGTRFTVWLQERQLGPSGFSLSNDVLTFNVNVFDSQAIVLEYFTGQGSQIGSPTYCSATDVQEEIQADTAFSDSTVPSETTINSWIVQAETKIENQTHHAWKETSVADEFYDIDDDASYNRGAGIRVPLMHRNIRAFDTNSGDKLEIWNGNEYIDWLTDGAHTEGRVNDFWLDTVGGNLYFRWRWPFMLEAPIRISYRYGESSVPGDIAEACSKMVSRRILLNEDRSFVLNETGDNRNMSYDRRISEFKKDIAEIIRARAEFFAI